MKIAIVVSIVIFTTSTISSKDLYAKIEEEWNLFKITYNKSYDDDTEDAYRKSVYLESKLKIERHNKLYETGKVSYSLGMNHFGDLTDQEFLKTMTGFKPDLDIIDTNHTFGKSENVTYPNYVNWVSQGYVTPVKDQKHCGSCWSFSATGAIEGQYFRKTRRLVSLSEQNLIDCSRRYGNNGCKGGNAQRAFQYVRENGGIDTENSYPYIARDDQRCRYNRQNVGAMVKGFRSVTAGDANLLAAVATVGPVSVGIEAVESFRLYKQGVYSERQCGYSVNHAVLVVGYGTTKNGAKYWMLKNSWGTSWGSMGFMFMTRDVSNMCRISDYGCYPIV